MGWFSPIKGHYPSLGQIDKTLPVAAGVTGISRGTIIAMKSDNTNADGVFGLPVVSGAGKTPVELLYVSLQDYDDAQAGMAGTTGFDGNVPSNTEGNITIPGVTAGVPTITGLSLSMEGEYETDNYAATGANSLVGCDIGTPLAVDANGVICKYTSGATSEVIGYLTGKVSTRWINNAIAKPAGETNPRLATRQGRTVPVIRFRTK